MRKFLTICIIFFVTVSITAAQTAKSIVSGIYTTSSSNRISVNWNLPRKNDTVSIASLYVFRNTRPIESVNFLKENAPVAVLPPNSLAFVDPVKDTREYYYAVICVLSENSSGTDEELYYDEELDEKIPEEKKVPYYVLLPGVNATVNGAKVKFVTKKEFSKLPPEDNFKTYEDNQLRDRPLPFMDILGDEAGHERKVSPSAQKKAEELFKKNKTEVNTEFLEPYIFEEDIVSPSGGDEYILFEILKNTFIQEKFDDAVKLLTRFTLQNRNREVIKRARFYLGESYYFMQNFPMALTQFLSTEEDFPSLSHRWIESTLTLFERR